MFALGTNDQWPGGLCSLFFQLVKKLSDLTGCTQVVDVGSGQVSQTHNSLLLFFVFFFVMGTEQLEGGLSGHVPRGAGNKELRK